MIVTFCGHSSVSDLVNVEKWLYDTTEDLILKGAKTFYLGGYGEFDVLCKRVLLKHKKKYSNIELILIVPYLNHNMITQGYDGTIYPEIENTPPKFAIVKRNKWMVEKADIVVAYVTHNFGGAFQTLRHAKTKRKILFPLKEYTID
ncbi:MAG: hypothetical protein R3Y35_08250 [Clostridia bacterium]